MSPRRGQILPFTLTELLAVLFFALALALVYQWQRHDAAQELLNDNSDLLAEAAILGSDETVRLVEIWRSYREEFPEDFHELNRELQSREEIRNTLSSELREAGLDSAFTDTSDSQSLLDTLVVLHRVAEREADALAASAGMPDSTRSILVELSGELEKSKAEVEDLRGQVTYMTRRLGNGLDHPPCWADAQGRPEYAFQVTLKTDAITVEPIWAAHRAADAQRVDGMTQAPGTDLSYNEFIQRALPVFEWSQRQDPECRHFVRIVDQVAGGKEPFKAGLLTVERFFYKLLAN